MQTVSKKSPNEASLIDRGPTYSKMPGPTKEAPTCLRKAPASRRLPYPVYTAPSRPLPLPLFSHLWSITQSAP